MLRRSRRDRPTLSHYFLAEALSLCMIAYSISLQFKPTMTKNTFQLFTALFILVSHVGRIDAQENVMSIEQAWNAIKTYQYGDDLQPLLRVESDIRSSRASLGSQIATAAKLATYLNDETTLAGRQFVCLQLRFVGTSSQVPVLTKYLNRTEDFDHIRMALEAIPGEESLIPLRDALKTSKGKMLIGVIESLAARADTKSIPELTKLIDSEDRAVAATAVTAIGTFESEIATLMKIPAPDLAQARLGALLRIANRLCDKRKTEVAGEIFSVLSSRNIPGAFRRAAFEGQLNILSEAKRNETIYQWFFEDDAEKNQVAASHLQELTVAQWDALIGQLDELPAHVKIVVLDIAAGSLSEQTLESLREALQQGNDVERLAALRVVGSMGDAEIIPLLIAILMENNPVLKTAVEDALLQLPREDAANALLAVLDHMELRPKALDILCTMKYYEAIDPLISLAQSEDATVFAPVIITLGKICDPDRYDIPRMLKLYLSSRPGVHRECVERAIAVICEKNPDPDTRADILIEFLKNEKGELTPTILVASLPLLGKVGNQQIADMVLPLFKSAQPDLRRSAIRAICNWPNADYHDVLWIIVKESPTSEYSRWALRAYVRVVTLPSDRPEAETLTMLQMAMQMADNAADKQWCMSRCSTIRTMESVEWIAGYLDDSVLSQTACEALAELAHHRFLREPNKERFDTILAKVEKITKDAKVIESVKKSRLGL